jgi:enoyl-CoA hydratase
MRLAQQIAANSPLAVSGTKTMINYAVEHTVAESLTYMATWQAGMFQMEDVFKAMESQKTKTLPDFPPLHGAVKKMKS